MCTWRAASSWSEKGREPHVAKGLLSLSTVQVDADTPFNWDLRSISILHNDMCTLWQQIPHKSSLGPILHVVRYTSQHCITTVANLLPEHCYTLVNTTTQQLYVDMSLHCTVYVRTHERTYYALGLHVTGMNIIKKALIAKASVSYNLK